MTLELPPVAALALRRVPAKPRKRIRSLWAWLVETTGALETALGSGGAAYQQRVMALQAGLSSADDHPLTATGLPSARAAQLLDGLNLFFVRQQHRDRTQFDALLRQSAGIVAEAAAAACDTTEREPAGSIGCAIARAELLRRVREGLQAGRLYVPLSEVTRFGANLEGMAAGRTTPQVQDLYWSELKGARESLDAARSRTRELPEELGRLAATLTDYETEMLARFESGARDGSGAEIRGLAALRFAMKKGAGR